jgi:N-acetylneuraminic acid mutarotase
LTIAERLRAHEAIERAYYTHQIGASVPFEEALPHAALEQKVRTYLKESVALEEYWSTPVSAEMLRAELERIARHTRLPDRLEEIYRALGDDSVLVQECLARPAVVDRLVRNFFAFDPRLHRAARGTAERLRRDLTERRLDPEEPSRTRRLVEYRLRGPEDREVRLDPAIPGVDGSADRSRVDLSEEAYRGVRARAPTQVGAVGVVEEDRERFVVQVLLSEETGSFAVARYEIPKRSWSSWWEEISGRLDERAVDAAVARVTSPLPRPSRSRDPWTAPGVEDLESGAVAPCDSWDNAGLDDVPDPHEDHTAVWSGTHMIVWGGSNYGHYLNSGGRYDPTIDTWTATSLVNAPTARAGHSAVWAGTVMVVWGGGVFTQVQTGGRYDPITDTWSPTSLSQAPSARRDHVAVWTGQRMLVWGGASPPAYPTEGGAYDPRSDSWTIVSYMGAPEGRLLAAAVWTGSSMVVWGGTHNNASLDTGGKYDPASDSWIQTSPVGAPSGRYGHTAVWSAGRMVIWGGVGASSGGRYDPLSDTWAPVSLTGAPPGAANHVATSTGPRMLVWGGRVGTNPVAAGGLYDPAADTWTPTSPIGAPTARIHASAVWTGSVAVIWGGNDVGAANSGGRYDPLTNTWTPTSTGGAPAKRSGHSLIWTGNEMIVWGGWNGDVYPIASGGRYDPLLDAWRPTTEVGAPSARYSHTGVWAGDRMVVWGGSDAHTSTATGGRYHPATDTWHPLTTTGAPSARQAHSAVWTGSRVIVWGGSGDAGIVRTGALYDPVSDTWTPTSIANAPSARAGHSAVWTGNRMVIWGGSAYPAYFSDGGRYDPATNTWSATSLSNAPLGRFGHTAVWTGSRMLVWGGGDAFASRDTGGIYDPAADTWVSTATVGAPTARSGHSAVWTGSQMIVWGGSDGDAAASGGRYSPASDRWIPTTEFGAPTARNGHGAVWTGSFMIVWGGQVESGWNTLSSGGRYGGSGDADQDGDGYPLCAGDCDDADPLRSPGAAEACDQVDNDCDGTVPADEFDLDVDGYAGCDGDCAPGDPEVYPGAPERNNHRDDSCPGDAGYGLVDELSGTLTVVGGAPSATICWPSQADATEYEIVRSNSGSFSEGCARVVTSDACWTDPEEPPGRSAFLYLVRPYTPHLGSFGRDSSGAERKDPCGRHEFRFQDTAQDDIGTGELKAFFTSVATTPSDFIHVSLAGPGFPDFEWCAERADFFRDQYMALASTGGLAVSGGWNVWYRESGGSWTGPVVDEFQNYFGDQCLRTYSWCPEVLLGDRSIAINPDDLTACEASDLINGCGGGELLLSITIARDRSSACGF